MTMTTNLGMTLLVAGQLQPEVTVNEDLNILDQAIGAASAFGYNSGATSGLTYAYFGAPIYVDGALVSVAGGTVTLAVSATNYVQRTPGGTVSVNQTGFNAGYIPMAEVVTGPSTITTVIDQRPAYYALGGLISIAVGAPTSPAVATVATGGTLAASTAYEYQLAAVYPWGESAPTAPVSVTTGTGTTNENTITWTDAPGATGVNVYGRVAGSVELLATVAIGTQTYTDTGSVAPSGVLPTGDMVLSEAEANAAILNFEGALAANTKISLPARSQVWVIANATTNPYTLSLTTAAATLSAVNVQQGSSEVLYVQSTGVVAASSAGGGGGAAGAITVQIGTGVTLTPTQAANSAIIRVQGAMTANAQLTFPANIEQIWEVSNETTGAYTLSALVDGSTDAALTLGQGDSQSVWSDGTNLRMTTGSAGPAGTIQIGTVTTGAAGSSASVSNSGTPTAAVLNFTIPQGETGNTGNTGPSGTLTVGTVTTGAAGSSATVTNSGTSTAAVLNFTIPQGVQGATGDIGTAGSTIQQPILVGEVETQVTNTASGTAATLNQSSGGVQALTLTGNCTLTLSPATGAAGVTAAMTIILTQDSTGSRTVTWPTGTIFTAGSAPTLSTTAGESDIFVAFLLAGSSNWVVAVIAQGQTL